MVVAVPSQYSVIVDKCCAEAEHFVLLEMQQTLTNSGKRKARGQIIHNSRRFIIVDYLYSRTFIYDIVIASARRHQQSARRRLGKLLSTRLVFWRANEGVVWRSGDLTSCGTWLWMILIIDEEKNDNIGCYGRVGVHSFCVTNVYDNNSGAIIQFAEDHVGDVGIDLQEGSSPPSVRIVARPYGLAKKKKICRRGD